MKSSVKQFRVEVFTCGGTIDKIYAEVRRTVNFSFGPSAVGEIFGDLRLNFSYRITPLLAKDSLEMNGKDRERIVAACRGSKSNRILITHGTDTMIKTARALSRIPGKTIVLTGAAQPYRFRDSDAPFNIGTAVGALNVLPPGVYVAINGRVYEWDKCQKLADGRFVEK